MTQLSATGRNYGVFKAGDEMLRQAFAKGEVPERVPCSPNITSLRPDDSASS